jgi:hypothetical protein
MFHSKRYSVGIVGLHTGRVRDLGYSFADRRRAEALAGVLNRLDITYGQGEPVTQWAVLKDGRLVGR